MSESRKEEQAELLIKFGELISPLVEITNYPEQQTAQTRSKAIAKYTHDRDLFNSIIADFCRGESGHSYKVELQELSGRLNRLTNQMPQYRDNPEKLKNELEDVKKTVISSILSIPCDIGAEVLEAGSPFTAFLKIRSLCETSNSELIFIDPYIGPSIVRRYFGCIRESVSVTVVTKMRRGGDEFDSFLELSKLYSDERGPSKYSLHYHQDLHDRYLKCDDDIFHLGGSIKDAGQKSGYTISKINSGLSQIQNILDGSAEQFGTSNMQHPNVYRDRDAHH